MAGEQQTLVEEAMTRLIKRFSMAPVTTGAAAGPSNRYISRRHRLEAQAHRDLGTIQLVSLPLDGRSWELMIRGIGSARNWLTADVAPADALDSAAIALLSEIDRALDGLLRRALLARQSLLARRRDALVQMSRAILAEHAGLQRLDHALDRHARTHEQPPVSELFHEVGGLRDRWLEMPGTETRAEHRPLAELGMAGSPREGYRFYLECVMHAASSDEAAQYLAGELASALHDGHLSASIEPIDRHASFLNDQLRLFADVVMDVRGDVVSRPAQAASSFQIAMERLGA
jgi:hypothetical protein